MSKILGALFVLVAALPAHAYLEKTYECANTVGVPNNTYKIENLRLGGASIPYLEVENYFRDVPGDPKSAIIHSGLRGFATVVTVGQTETLMLAAMSIDFEKDEIANCRKLLALSRELRSVANSGMATPKLGAASIRVIR